MTRDTPYDRPAIVVLICLLSIGMGVQNATARPLAVADLTTTVLTRALTGIAADSRVAGGAGGWSRLRMAPIASVFLGAFIGALLVQARHGRWVLLVAVLLLAVVSAAAAYTSKSNAAWTERRSRP